MDASPSSRDLSSSARVQQRHASNGERPRQTRMTPRYTPLLRRVFATNAAVLVAAGVLTVLVLSPGIVSSPIALKELAILVCALGVMLVVNGVLLRRALAPLERLTMAVRQIDPLRPGKRVPVEPEASEAKELAETVNAALDRLEDERRESSGRALAAQESERLRVAQELHDEIGQGLTAVLLQLGRTADRLPSDLREEVLEAQETARAGLEDVRRIAQRLRPEALDDLGLLSALRVLRKRIAEQTGLCIEERLAAAGLPVLTREEELVIYRIAQEALTNVARHAQAANAKLVLERAPQRLTLRVVDDGRGLRDATAGSGIRGMIERALLINADLHYATSPAGGTEVRLDIPVGVER